MSDRKDGGPAFPVFDSMRVSMDYACADAGMALRDWFAGQALNKLARPTRPRHDECYEANCKNSKNGGLGINARECIEWDARVCYAYADAMLKAREGQGDEGD